ncbi:MAG TPA: glycoside hydrolase family 127 protein [bacterium]|nr:glycoside hydrolase family 127 protein [bacterium]HQJ65744.1 glycoside hydrolase family 127 protein [bacterium]
MKPAPLLIAVLLAFSTGAEAKQAHYPVNRPPLREKPYLELPLGAIHPMGWLQEQLEIMRDGMTGHLDVLYSSVVGPRNGWLGGDGDGWERGPYWIDGLLPLAWILGDSSLMAKARLWIEWSLRNQQPDGYFGPLPLQDPAPEPGLQKGDREDWWPKMVMLKVLMQYYDATGDARVLTLMDRYFRFQLAQLPKTPLDHWTIWANRRGGDNLQAVYWLYNRTGAAYLLHLADLLAAQTFPWTQVFLNDQPADFYTAFPGGSPWIYDQIRYPWKTAEIAALSLRGLRGFHCVNLAQGIKQPVIYYQQHPEQTYLEAVHRAFADIRAFHGQVQGMYGADEPMHGNAPTQGIELCAIVEMMYSLECMLPITADPAFADHLERLAYNALPAQITDDFSARQYFQCANQVMATRARHNFYEDAHHGGTDLCFGLLTGYPCCTCNLHQGWPKLVQNLWYATIDGGAAALVYGPSRVELSVGAGEKARISEETTYPFSDCIRFRFVLDKQARFPFVLRVPGWCDSARIEINGRQEAAPQPGTILRLVRKWHSGDVVELHLPMVVKISRWADGAVGIERGPLVYGLRIGEVWKRVENRDKWGDYWEVYPRDPWNWGLLEAAVLNPAVGFAVVERESTGLQPWSLETAPVELHTRGKRIPEWQLYGEMAGPMPWSPQLHLQHAPAEPLVLIPYGCTTLRVSEFPVVR